MIELESPSNKSTNPLLDFVPQILRARISLIKIMTTFALKRGQVYETAAAD